MLRSIKSLTSYLYLVCLAVFLTACGGGDSSSGGGTDTTTATAPYMGTYRGPFSVTVAGPGAAPAKQRTSTQSGITTIVVNTDNSVVVDPGPDQFPGRYNPETQKMIASFPGSQVDPTCKGTVTMAGDHIFDSNANTQ